MWKDPVVDEVRAVRDAYAKKFGYDLEAMARDLRAKEAQNGHPLVQPAPRPAALAIDPKA